MLETSASMDRAADVSVEATPLNPPGAVLKDSSAPEKQISV
jgi:hypothetical protein